MRADPSMKPIVSESYARCRRRSIGHRLRHVFLPARRAIQGIFFIVISLVIFAVTATPQNLLAQEQVSESEWKRGFHGFNIVCKNSGLVHESYSQWLTVPANQKILVVLGEVSNIRINVDRFIERGGAVLIATDRQNSSIVRRQGIGFTTANIQASFQRDCFQNFPDCPIVTDTRIHPSLENVDSIVTNRPGLLTPTRRGPDGPKMIAYLPSLIGSFHSNRFIATVERNEGGRLMCVADQSVFANQMLIHGDNAIFAAQAMEWLKSGGRTHLLVIADGAVQSAVDPSGVEVRLPPPSRQQVLDAIRNLPPAALLEFGNVVATVVEDENMVNEFIHSSVDQVPPVVMRRALILMSFAFICLVTLFTFVWQKKLMRQTAGEVAFKKARKARKSKKATANGQSEQWAHQRRAAAGALLDSFCREIGNRHYDDWGSFPKGLVEAPDPETQAILKSMRRASKQYKKKKPAFWTTLRLKQLEQDVANWKVLFRSGSNVLPDIR